MKTLDRYLFASFIVAFLVTLMVFTFVMSIGVVFRITDLLARDVSWKPVVLIMLCGVPPTLVFSIPISLMTCSLLVFGRLSADGEITAMKVCGVSVWRIMATPLLVATVFTMICMYMNSELVPRLEYKRRSAIAELGMASPVDLLQEGQFMQNFGGLSIYISKKKDNHVYGIRIFDQRNPDVKREIFAEEGIISADASGSGILIDLFKVRIDPYEMTGLPGYCEKLPLKIENVVADDTKIGKRCSDITFQGLLGGIRDIKTLLPDIRDKDKPKRVMSLKVELSKRIVISLSCLAFVMVGIPLGVKAQRKESTLGVAMSLAVAGFFYLFVVVADSFSSNPSIRPDLIVWIPVCLSMFVGVLLVKRSN